MAAALPKTPLPVVEWALGPIGCHIDAVWIYAPAAAALQAVLERASASAGASSARASPAQLTALRLAGARRDSSRLEREYAALFEPLREARAVALECCSNPGDAPSLHDVDVSTARRVTPVDVVEVVEVDRGIVATGLLACGLALASSADVQASVLALYDELDFTPARVAKRLRTLQMAGVPATGTVLAREDEYAALFQLVRHFRHMMRDALTPAAAEGGAGTGTVAVDGAVTEAIKRLRTTLAPADAVALRRVWDDVFDDTELKKASADATIVSIAAVAAATHESVPADVERACVLLADVACHYDDTLRDAFSSCDGFVLLASVLTRHRSDAAVVESAGCATFILAREDTAAAFAAAGVFEAIAAALATHSDNACVAGVLCSALSSFAASAAVRPAIAAAGSVGALVTALIRHADHFIVASATLLALQHLARSDTGKAAIVAAGGIPALVAALCKFVDHPTLAEGAVDALAWLASTGDDNRSAVLAAGGVVAAVMALTRRAGDRSVVEQAACILDQLSRQEASHSAILAAGGVAPLVAALTRHVQSAGVVNRASSALRMLVARGRNTHALVAAGCIPPLVAALSWHADSFHGAHGTSGVLYGLAQAKSHRPAIVAAGAIPALTAALSKHGAEAAVVEVTAGSLCQLTGTAASTASMIAAGGVEATVAALSACLGSTQAAKFCCMLLSHFAATVESSRGLITAAGGVAALDAAAAAHRDDEMTVAAVECALHYIGS